MFEAWTLMDVINVITAVVTAAGAIAATTPWGRDDEMATKAEKYWKKARRVINVLGLNVGKAQNKED